jgi:hypothetical protein
VDLPGDLGAGIRDHASGSRYKKKTMRAPPATSKKEQQLRVQLQQQGSQWAEMPLRLAWLPSSASVELRATDRDPAG